VVVINPTRETVATSVISRPTSATKEFSVITKIRKYKGLHEGHHFIPMAMEVHDAPEHGMDCFIRECACFSMKDNREIMYPCFFAFSFLGNVLILLFDVL